MLFVCLFVCLAELGLVVDFLNSGEQTKTREKNPSGDYCLVRGTLQTRRPQADAISITRGCCMVNTRH